MKLDKIELANYRNISSMELAPCDGINVIYGDNAQGKTNLIEAIWLFTGNQSFRGSKTGELVRFGEEAARLRMEFSDRERTQTAELAIGDRRKILLNHVELKTLGDLNGNFFAVVFSPSHLSFIKDGPKNRRKFIDIAISQLKPQYKNYLNLYEKLVEQRNALLRNAYRYTDLEQNIDVWDLQLAKAGTIISIYRNDYVSKLHAIAENVYEGLSAQRERLSIRYESTIFDRIEEVTVYDDAHVQAYYEKLKESYSSDFKQGFTTLGVHRDDLEVLIDGHSVRTYGSQGQQRSSVITLKLSEANLLRKVTGENPIMLLDDVMSELDVSRQDYILNHLKGMQVFITCCDISNTLKLETGNIFHIQNGMLSTQTNRRGGN